MATMKISELIRRFSRKDEEVQPLTIYLEPKTVIDCVVSCPLGVVDETPYSVYHKETVFSYPSVVHNCLKRFNVSFPTLQATQDWIINHCLTTSDKIEDCQIVREYPAEYNI